MGQISLLCLALITTMMMKAAAAEEMECRPNPLENGFVEQTGVGVFTFKCKIRVEWRPLIGPDPSRYCALIG